MKPPANLFSYDTIEVGDVFVSMGRTITDAENLLFTMLSGSWHPVHCDKEFAKTTPFGRPVVHAVLGLTLVGSLQSGLILPADPAVGGLGLKDWIFKVPLFVGDTVHIELEIVGKRITSRGDRYIVERVTRLINQHGVVALQGWMGTVYQLPARISGAAPQY